MKRDTKHNITDEILKAAAKHGIYPYATGGGMDYIVNEIDRPTRDGGAIMVLGLDGDAGSPEKLSDPSTVTIYFDGEDWSNSKSLRFLFDTAEQAIEFMAGKDARGLDSVGWR